MTFSFSLINKFVLCYLQMGDEKKIVTPWARFEIFYVSSLPFDNLDIHPKGKNKYSPIRIIALPFVCKFQLIKLIVVSLWTYKTVISLAPPHDFTSYLIAHLLFILLAFRSFLLFGINSVLRLWALSVLLCGFFFFRE